jgi:hypothetical protein
MDTPGIIAGGYVNFIFSNTMALALQPAIRSYSFKIDYTESIEDVLQLSQTEKHTQLELPVYLQFTFFKNKIQPFINLGFKAGYLVASETRGSMSRIDSENLQVLSSSVTYSRNNLAYRNRFNIYPGGALGVKINFNNIYIFGQADYHHSFKNVLKEDRNRFDQNNLWTEGWFDSDFRLAQASFRVGIVLGIYRIQKIR